MTAFEEIAHYVTARAAQTAAPFLLAIDGRCGSGKSTLARFLAQKLPAAVIHTDDFYLPFSLRTPSRMSRPGGHIEAERLRSEILLPALQKKEITYKAFRPHTHQWLPSQNIALQKVYIVEGSYSLLPSLNDLYHCRIFLTLSPEVQRQRLLLREGKEKISAFLTHWMGAEERYFQTYRVQESADKVYDTTAWW